MTLNWSEAKNRWPNAPASQFVKAAGFTWHVQISGRGPDLLLLHGTGSSTHSWRALFPSLATQFRVVAPDLPGHAFSELPSRSSMTLPGMGNAVATLLAELGVQPRWAVGHSAGASILCQMHLDNNFNPNAIISLNGAFLPFQNFWGQFFAPLSRVLLANPLVPGAFARLSSERSVRRLIHGTGSSISTEDLERYVELITDADHVLGALTMMANWDLNSFLPQLGRIQVPLHLVVASRDRAVPPTDAETIAARVPRCSIHRIENLGHLAHEEDPGSVRDLIFDVAQVSSPLGCNRSEPTGAAIPPAVRN